jgi:hypothetical protein
MRVCQSVELKTPFATYGGFNQLPGQRGLQGALHSFCSCCHEQEQRSSNQRGRSPDWAGSAAGAGQQS